MKSVKVFSILAGFILFITGCSITYSSLLRAVNKNDINKANELIDLGADVNENKNSNKYTPLMLAAYNGNYDMAKLLIDKGADVNENNNRKNYSPLMWACNMGQLDVAKLLLERGANINSYYGENRYYTALYLAIECNDYKYKNNNILIQLLLKRGAKVYNEHLQAANKYGGLEYETLKMLKDPYLKDNETPKENEKTPSVVVKINNGKLVGLVKSVDGASNEVIVSSVVIGQLVNIGDTLYCVCDGSKVNMEVTFPMQTIAKCKLADKRNIAKLKVGETVYK
jgi:ankyrin repeat protein